MLKHSDILGSLLPFAACCTKVRSGPEVPSATAYQNTLFEGHRQLAGLQRWEFAVSWANIASRNTVSQHINLKHCVQQSKSSRQHFWQHFALRPT